MKWFNNASLSTKLITTTLFGGISLLIVGIINFSTLKNVLKFYSHVAEINLPNAETLGVMKENTAIIGVHLNELYSQFSNGNYAGEEFGEITAAVNLYERSNKDYTSIEFVPGEEELYKPIVEIWKKNRESFSLAQKINDSKDPGQKEKMHAIVEQTTLDLETQLKLLSKLSEFQHGEGRIWIDLAKSAASVGQTVALGAIIFFFTLAVLVGIMLSRSLSARLRELALELNKGAENVAGASNGLSSTAQELSQATTEQAASLEETAASIEEMASMVSKNSENSNNTASLASQSHSSATQGEVVVRSMISSMNDINQSNKQIMDAVNQSNKEISEIIKVITEIGNKTKVINDIVFQTKLLSFNASVEAARAGEHGKGFAVVAEEVGNLAQMSGNAAKEISAMLEGSIEKVESIVHDTQNRVERLIEEGHSKVEHGTSVAQECGRVLHEIVENVAKVTRMAQEISAASNEQSKGVGEISKAMNQLDHVTQQNAQTSDATASSSEQLSRQASNLRTVVGRLMQEIEGQSHYPHNNLGNGSSSTPTQITKPQKDNVYQLNTASMKPKLHSNVKTKLSSETHHQKTTKIAASTSPTTATPSFDDSRFEDV
jgi:methyl-accepting chemotaxis protein